MNFKTTKITKITRFGLTFTSLLLISNLAFSACVMEINMEGNKILNLKANVSNVSTANTTLTADHNGQVIVLDATNEPRAFNITTATEDLTGFNATIIARGNGANEVTIGTATGVTLVNTHSNTLLEDGVATIICDTDTTCTTFGGFVR